MLLLYALTPHPSNEHPIIQPQLPRLQLSDSKVQLKRGKRRQSCSSPLSAMLCRHNNHDVRAELRSPAVNLFQGRHDALASLSQACSAGMGSTQPWLCDLNLQATSYSSGIMLQPTLSPALQALRATAAQLQLRHPNLQTVMGTSIDPVTRDLLVVLAYLERGTLYDLLHNEVGCEP